MKELVLIIFLSMSFVGCSDEDVTVGAGPSSQTNEVISEQVLDGYVHGVAWTFLSGRVKKSSFGDSYTFSFWNESIANPCDDFQFGSDSQLIGLIPFEVGTHSFGNTTNLNFSYDGENLISTNGRVEVTEITEERVVGKLVTSFDNDNEVNGSFELTFCE